MPYAVPDSVILEAQRGDASARRRIFDTFLPPVRVTVGRLLSRYGREEVEDAVQEVFLKLFAHLRDFDFERRVRFSTWLYALVRNHCFDRLKRRRLRCLPLDGPLDGSDDDEGFERVGVEAPPWREAARREFVSALERELKRLPSDLARVFALREIEGLSFRRIARRLGEPVGTVKSRHYRALERLRHRLRGFRPAA